MSIPNLSNKIKSVFSDRNRIGIDKETIVFLCIIVGVGISSFGLGRLSMDNKQDQNDDIIINSDYKGSLNAQNEAYSQEAGKDQEIIADRRYVASKNGKMYYSLNCSGAGRIKTENQIWFSTKEDAEKSGFTLSSSCQ